MLLNINYLVPICYEFYFLKTALPNKPLSALKISTLSTVAAISSM